MEFVGGRGLDVTGGGGGESVGNLLLRHVLATATPASWSWSSLSSSPECRRRVAATLAVVGVVSAARSPWVRREAAALATRWMDAARARTIGNRVGEDTCEIVRLRVGSGAKDAHDKNAAVVRWFCANGRSRGSFLLAFRGATVSKDGESAEPGTVMVHDATGVVFCAEEGGAVVLSKRGPRGETYAWLSSFVDRIADGEDFSDGTSSGKMFVEHVVKAYKPSLTSMMPRDLMDEDYLSVSSFVAHLLVRADARVVYKSRVVFACIEHRPFGGVRCVIRGHVAIQTGPDGVCVRCTFTADPKNDASPSRVTVRFEDGDAGARGFAAFHEDVERWSNRDGTDLEYALDIQPDAVRWSRREALGSAMGLDDMFLHASVREFADIEVRAALAALCEKRRAPASWVAEGYRRGYLLHGPPGGGKSTLARAMARAMGLPVYVVDLSLVRTDEDLDRVADALPSDCAVVMDDVDRSDFFAHGGASDREDDISSGRDYAPRRRPVARIVPDDKSATAEERIAELVKTFGQGEGPPGTFRRPAPVFSKSPARAEDRDRTDETAPAQEKKLGASAVLRFLDGAPGRFIFLTANIPGRLGAGAFTRPGRIDRSVPVDARCDPDRAAEIFRAIVARGAPDVDAAAERVGYALRARPAPPPELETTAGVISAARPFAFDASAAGALAYFEALVGPAAPSYVDPTDDAPSPPRCAETGRVTT